MSSIKTTVCVILGAIGSFIANLVGGWTEDMATLVTFMAIDFIMGLLIALVFKKSNKSYNGTADSKVCFKGLCKKGVILLFVLIAHRLDLALNCDYIRTATIIGFMANELLSIIENAGIMGVPLPSVITRAIETLKDKGDSNDSK